MTAKMARAADSHERLAALLSEMLNDKVTRREVEAPTSEFMTKVFYGVFKEAGLNETAFEMSQFLVPAHVSSFVPTLHLNKLMQVVFTKLGVPDFGLSDISDPEPKRSRKLLSILCNFWVRLGRQWNMWSDIEVGLAAAKTDREAKRAQLDAVKAKVNQLSQHPGINPERLAAAQGELAAENKALATKEPKQAVVMNDYKNLKSAKCQVTEQLKKSEVEVLDLRPAVHDVQARICHSPERQRWCLAEEAETASQLQEEHCHLQTRVEELRRKMQKAPREREASTKLKTQLHSSLAVAQRLESLVQDKDNASARRKSAEDKYHRLLKEREAVAEKKSQLNGQTAFQHQAMQSQLSFKKEQLVQAKQRLEELHLERQEVVCSKDSEVAGLDAEIRQVQDEAKKVRQSLADKVAETRLNSQRVFARHEAMLKMAEKVFFPEDEEPSKDAEGASNL
ncbi:kinetochore protein Nuf2-like [Ixodes scapularis]|uniref:kinetochore protein Nuf2-like n=1 Tax=Ixodes scapularis TaxID=6945 RepID=UPI001A9E40BC|nr:kinetochore protein Nuf2-like [Ixodes scapularis]